MKSEFVQTYYRAEEGIGSMEGEEEMHLLLRRQLFQGQE